MVRVRLVACDVDGTLLRSDGTWSDYTGRVLQRLNRTDVNFVLVTARPMRWMDQLTPLVGPHGLAVVSNGAIVYEPRRRRVSHLDGIAPEQGLEVAARIRAALPQAAFAIETVDGIAVETEFNDPNPLPPGSPLGPLSDIWVAHAAKLLVRAEGVPDEVMRRAVVDAVGDDGTPTWTGFGLVEVGPPGVTKASALVSLCQEMGVEAAEVVAFGDMPNDIPMLRWAGLSYAVSNADPAVQAVADAVVASNDEDGVARTLADLCGITEEGRGVPQLPRVLSTDRFRLELVRMVEVEAVREGRRSPAWHPDYPREEDLAAFSMMRSRGAAVDSWGPRHIVRAFDGMVIGSIGFHGPPTDGEAEVGFGLVEYARRRGVMRECLQALVSACESAGIGVRASVEPTNQASFRLLSQCGFTDLRGSNADGLLVLARPRP